MARSVDDLSVAEWGDFNHLLPNRSGTRALAASNRGLPCWKGDREGRSGGEVL